MTTQLAMLRGDAESESLCLLLEQLSDSALLHCSNRLVHVNQPCLEMLGFDDAREIVGRSIRELLHPDDWRLFESRLAQVQATGMPADHAEERFCDRIGRAIRCDVVEVPVAYVDGPAVVTIARRCRTELGGEASGQFADRLAMVETLAAGVAHGINNPLSYVKSNVAFTVAAIDTLLEESRSDDAARCLGEIRHVLQHAEDGANRIAGIVSDLLVFSRQHCRGESSLGVDLHDLLDAVVRLTTHAHPDRVRLETHHGPVPLVDGDAWALAQAFANIVQNAVQSRPVDCAEPHTVVIHSWTDEGSGRAVVSVRDEGEGMDPDVLCHAFEPFFTTRPVGQGSGLGLPVALGIVRSAGGELDIESEPGRGTCVRVSLPARERGLPGSTRAGISRNGAVVERKQPS